ncbi:MAG: protein kinase [Anaerolineales bacterium]|jgi:serine/threonine protein kinase
MATIVGQTLASRYHVEEEVGRGGMAVVYKVWDSERTVHLAMKLLQEDLAIDKVFLRRFKREAQTLAKLQHPNIVRLYGLEKEGRLAFMLMDFVDGDSLKHEIFDSAGPMTTDRVLEVTRAVCSALNYAHSLGMVHCDIKPGNILIEKTGRVLVSDFGIARMTDAATSTMVGFGTPAYMSPEIVRGSEPTPQSDIYSLGVMLFEMFAGGERPFTGEKAEITGSTSDKVRWEQVNLKPPSLSTFNKEIPTALEAVVAKCLAKAPGDRYGSVIDLLNALTAAAGEAEPAAVAAAPAAPEEAEAQREKPPAAKKRRRKKPVPAKVAPKAAPSRKPPPEKAPSPAPVAKKQRPTWVWIAGAAGLALVILALGNALLGDRGSLPTVTTPPPVATPTSAILTATTGANNTRPNGTPITASFLTTPPTIDGDLSEWTTLAYSAGNIVHGTENWTGGSDLYAIFYAGWDASYLYLAVRVTDDQFVQESSGEALYKGDVIELQFDANLSGDFDQDTLSSDDYQIGLSPGNFGGIPPEAYRWYPASLSGPLATASLQGAQTPQGWDLEARLPWSEFGVSAIAANRFGFALSVSDNDLPGTGEQQSMVSSVSTRLHLDPTSWGTLILGQ